MQEEVYLPNKDKAVTFLALDIYNGNSSQVRQFKALTGFTFPVLMQGGTVQLGWGTETALVADADGRVRGIFRGSVQRQQITPLIDELLATPMAKVSSTALAFGSFDAGSATSATLKVRNDGTAPLELTGYETDVAGLTGEVPVTIPPGASADVPVSVSRDAAGAIDGTLTLLSNDPANGRIEIAVTGTVVAATGDARLDFDGSGRIDFGDFVRFAGAYGSNDATYDLTGDGVVGFDDFVAFAQDFGRPVD